jgi:SPP1 family predicted phage head-tail adaptor
MRAGRLDRKIIFETLTETRDEFGAVSESWNTWREVWAQVMPMSAQERFLSDAKRSVRVNKFKIRYLKGLLSTMRIRYEGLIYNITGIAELGRFEGYEITGEAVN